jgi:predicted GIY-YIG superfamily endonuclease
MTTFYVYILKLENGKYYVGKSTNVERRFQQHLNGKGSNWTNFYKPLQILEFTEEQTEFDEDNKTKQLMIEHGIDNVRGGSYTKTILEDWQIKSLETEFKGIKSRCYKCGQKGHYATECGKQKKSKYEGWTEEQLETRKNELTAKLEDLESVSKSIWSYVIDFGTIAHHMERHGRPIMTRSGAFSQDLLNQKILLSANYKKEIKNVLNNASVTNTSANSAVTQAYEHVVDIVNKDILNYIKHKNTITDGNGTVLNMTYQPDATMLQVYVREIVLNNKRQTKLLNELLKHDDQEYKNYEEIRPVIIKQIGEILDALIELA